MDRLTFIELNDNILFTAKNSLISLLKMNYFENNTNNSIDLNNSDGIKSFEIDDRVFYPKNIYMDECDRLTLLYNFEYTTLLGLHENQKTYLESLSLEELILLTDFVKDNFKFKK